MHALEFCYWLQGFIEISNPQLIDESEIDIIKDHLQLVFNKVTPDRSKIDNKKIDELFKQPYCASIPIDLNVRSYCSSEPVKVDYNNMTNPDGSPCPSCK